MRALPGRHESRDLTYEPQHRHSNHRTSEPGRLAKNFDFSVDSIDDNPSSTNPPPATPPQIRQGTLKYCRSLEFLQYVYPYRITDSPQRWLPQRSTFLSSRSVCSPGRDASPPSLRTPDHDNTNNTVALQRRSAVELFLTTICDLQDVQAISSGAQILTEHIRLQVPRPSTVTSPTASSASTDHGASPRVLTTVSAVDSAATPRCPRYVCPNYRIIFRLGSPRGRGEQRGRWIRRAHC